jgi:hypothetical protein
MTHTKPKSKGGRPPVHGGYSLMVRAGELPKRRTCLRAYLTEIREGLIRDIAGTEEELTTAQRVLVDRACSLLSIIRCVEEHTREHGVFKGRELAPVLLKSYTAYSAELRRTLEMLGIKGRAADKAMTPLEIAAEIDAEKGKAEEAISTGPMDESKAAKIINANSSGVRGGLSGGRDE